MVTQYVALLRGINVGGRNPVAMARLREVFTSAGFATVATHIASGNVLFGVQADAGAEAGGGAGGVAEEIEDRIERLLAAELELPVPVVLRSAEQMRRVVEAAPPGFGGQPDRFHSDAVFLKKPLTVATALEVVELADGVDAVWPGDGVLYFQRVSALRTRSRMNRIMGTPQYRLMTIRSWKTTTKLRELLDQR